jgi:hypothetical protein
VSSTSLWTLPVVLRPQAALSEMLPVRSAAGLPGTPNERSESPCECPFACRGRPLAASLAQSVRRDESARIATAHRYTPALHGLRCRPVDSAPHVCIYALHQLALRIACACMWCVCVLARARARARQSLTKKSPLPALIMHIPAAAACRCHMPVTGSQCHECHIGRASVRTRACVRVRARQDLTAITPPPPPHMRMFSQQQLADRACR